MIFRTRKTNYQTNIQYRIGILIEFDNKVSNLFTCEYKNWIDWKDEEINSLKMHSKNFITYMLLHVSNSHKGSKDMQ